MKIIIISIQILSILLILNSVCNGQSITVEPNDTVNLKIPVYTGTLQWEESVDSITWNDISGATYQPYQIIALSSKFYRARINNGMCNPVYSGGRHVIVTVFVCGISTLTDIDGNIYNTVLIGSQCWMKENLNYGTYVTAATGQGGTGTQKYCFGDNTANCTTYGGLYEWAEMMNGSASCNGTGAPPNDKCATNVQGICPIGWHVPSHYEWITLEKNVGTNPGAFPYDESTTGWLGTDEGDNLKETGTSHWITPNTGATNSSGFTALPGGSCSIDGTFYNVGNFARWWSATEVDASFAWNRDLSYNSTNVGRNGVANPFGLSVRCLRD